MHTDRTRYEYYDNGVKMRVSTFNVYELINGRKVYRTIDTRNPVDVWGLD
jgi:CRISPR/Cas system-associated protein Csx1